jgi:hypothetical protein
VWKIIESSVHMRNQCAITISTNEKAKNWTYFEIKVENQYNFWNFEFCKFE